METTKEMYAEAGEFYDVVSDEQWRLRKTDFQRVLSLLGAVEGVILDIGSGTGHGVVVAAEALPDADIFAIEPSPTMRTALLSRVMQTGDLRQRVTVIPSTFETAELPDRLRAVLFLGCIGFVDDNVRRGFWARLAPRMSPEALVLVDVMMISRPQIVEKTRLAKIPVGHNTYHVWLEGVPKDDLYQNWLLTYQITKDGVSILERKVEFPWRTLSLEDIAVEAAPYGFEFEKLTDTLIPSGMLRRTER